MQPNFERMIAAVSSHPSLTHGRMVNANGIPCTTGALLLSVFPTFQHDLTFAVEQYSAHAYSEKIEQTQVAFGIGNNTWMVLQHFNDWYSSVGSVTGLNIRDGVLVMLRQVQRQWMDSVAIGGEPTSRAVCDRQCATLVSKYYVAATADARLHTEELLAKLNTACAEARATEVYLTSELGKPRFGGVTMFKKPPQDQGMDFSVEWESLLATSEKLLKLEAPLKFSSLFGSFKLAHDKSPVVVHKSLDKAHTDAVLEDLIESTKVDLAANDEMLVGVFTKV